MRAAPAAVFGPVLSPPWLGQRPLPRHNAVRTHGWLGLTARAHDDLSQRNLDRRRAYAGRAHCYHRGLARPVQAGTAARSPRWLARMPASHRTMALGPSRHLQTRTPAEQLLRTEAVTARYLRDDGALNQALGDDNLGLLPCRPPAPTLHTRDYLNPSRTRRRRHFLRVITTVNTMVKTMPAHGPSSSGLIAKRAEIAGPGAVACVIAFSASGP
jgi:hypothetical protein